MERGKAVSTEHTAAKLKALPTITKGQCCSLKVDDGETRVWLCRGDDESVSVEKLVNGRWELKEDHVHG